MTTTAAPEPGTVALLALAETTPATLYGLYEVFSAVGAAWPELTGEATGVAPLQVRIVARQAEPFRSVSGPPIAPEASLDAAGAAGTVIVTDLALAPEVTPRGRWPAETAWLRACFEAGARVCSVCTGALVLAEAGLLEGREATTHWSAVELFRRHYPGVRLRPERILCPDGPEHRLLTAGGVSSWEDLALYLIARLAGGAEAVRMAKLFLIGDRSDGQLPFSAMGRPRRHQDRVIGDCQAWIAEHYANAAPVARMAARSGLAERTFKRRFKAATGYAPVDYVQALRVEEAKQLLETTDAPTDAVAHAVGYQDPAYFRLLFKRRTGVTPARYRRRFQPVAGPR